MLVYYITAHGYGHGARSCDVLRAVRTLHPEIPITVVSALPEGFLRARLGAGIPVRAAALDLGMVQLDSVRADASATLTKLQALYARRDALVEQEARFLAAVSARMVAVDIPAMPLAAAARLGIPGIAIGNFGWDWIYEEYLDEDPGWARLIDQIRTDYTLAEEVLRLPFSEPMAAFRRRRDIPLVAAPGRPRREELAALTGADPRRPWVLLSFTTLEWNRAAIERVCADSRYVFFTVLPLSWELSPIHAVDRNNLPFSDTLATVDAVVSKPGFGIVSECIVNHKPLLYVDRTHFREYPYLVEGIRRYLRHIHIPSAAFYEGDVVRYLDQLPTVASPTETLTADQGRSAARILWTHWCGK